MQGYTGQGQPEQGEGHITLLPTRYAYTTAGRWVLASNAVYNMYSILYNISQVQNDRVDYFVWLSRGTYTLSLSQTKGQMGICTYYLDDVSLGTIDWYKADPAAYGFINTITDIPMTLFGRHIFSIKVTSKNASSAYYYAYLHSMAFYRTA